MDELEARMADLDEFGSTGALAKAISGAMGVIDRLSKGKVNDGPLPGPTKNSAPSKVLGKDVTPKAKAVASMGGNPEAHREVGTGEVDGDTEEEAETEPDDGKARIRKERSKAKTSVPSVNDSTLKRSFGAQSGPPQDEGAADDDDDGDDGEAGGDDDGSGEQEMQGQPTDGDTQVSPELQAILAALAQNPQLMQALMAMQGGGAPADPNAMPAGAPGMGAPAPAVPPHTHDDPALVRSMSAHQDAFEKSLGADPRREQLLEAIDASPALEAVLDHMAGAFAKSMALMERLVERQTVLEEAVAKSMSLQVNLASSLVPAAAPAPEEPVAKSQPQRMVEEAANVTPAPPIQWPAMGLMTPFSKSQAETSDRTNVDKNLLSKSLNDQLREGDRSVLKILGYLDVPNGINEATRRMSSKQWQHYQDLASAAT